MLHARRSDRPRHTRVLAQIIDERHVLEARGLEPRVHGICLIEAVLDDERATGLEMRGRGGADAIVEHEAIGAAIERHHRLATDLG